MSDEDFSARYDCNPADWFEAEWWPSRHDGSMRYAADMWDLGREASLTLRLNLDVQVQPEFEYTRFEGKDRVRLDDVEQIEDAL